MLMLNKNDFLFKFDLKSGHHHLDIFEPHQSYLGLTWEWNSTQSYFVFTVLPFGLSTIVSIVSIVYTIVSMVQQ